jgi:hypothetical protein
MKEVLVPLIIMLVLSLPAVASATDVQRLHDSVDRKLKLAEARASLNHAETLRLRAKMNELTKLIHEKRSFTGNSAAKLSLSSVTFRLKSIEQAIDNANQRAIASRRLLPFF